MRTSLNNVQTIERFLIGSMAVDDQVVFEATRLVDRQLADEVRAQRTTYEIIEACGRAQLRDELNDIHHNIMNNPSKSGFRNLILSFFK